MRKISANYIFPVTSAPLKNGIIVLNNDNQIVDLIDTNGLVKEISNLEFHSGVIVPGLIDVFTLLSYPSFSPHDFMECISKDFMQTLQTKLKTFPTDSGQIQRGLNHFEAFGTVAAADINPLIDDGLKQKSRLQITDIDLQSDKFKLHTHLSSNVHNTVLINRYTLQEIESTLIDTNQTDNFCIGTGSLKSHQKLSVFEELKEIQAILPQTTCWDLLKWATINGAKYLNLEQKLGSLEPGKTPGLNLLSKLDYKQQKLTKESELVVLVKN